MLASSNLKMFKKLTISGLDCYLKRQLSSFAKRLPDHRALMIEKFGDPLESVILKTRKPSDVLPAKLEPKQVLLEHLAACVNPADINLIQGVYGLKPTLPATLGNEGITRVLEVGSEVKHLSPGDMALGLLNVSYWQSYSVQDAETLFKVDKNLDVNTAAQLKVNPCTAYRMIKDYCRMQPGETLIQNGANSAVGVYVIQLAKYWGIKTLNVIRERPNQQEVIDELKNFGADFVVTEAELRNNEFITPILQQIGKPRLFLNCVCGENAVACHRLLDNGGFSVTYGFMSKKPLMVGAQALFKDHKLHFFWMSRWYQERERLSRHEISAMLEEIADMFNKSILKPKSSTSICFEDRDVAFAGSNNTKYIFSINK